MAALFLLAACAGPEPAPGPASAPRSEPPVPAELQQLDPGVREALEAAIARARREAGSGAAHGDLAVLYHAHKYVDLAWQSYATARRYAPEDARWWYLAGVLAEDRGRTDESEELYERCLALAPDYTAARYRLGNVRLAAGSPERALQSYEPLLEQEPNRVWGLLGLARVALRQGRPERAAELLEEARGLDPANQQVSYLLATAYRELGRIEDVSTLLESIADAGVRAAGPPDPWLELVRGGLRSVESYARAARRSLENGDLAGGQRLYRRVLELDPEHWDALFNLGLAAGREQRFEEARPLLERAVLLRPEAAEAHFVLALTLGSLGEYEAAEREVARVLEIDPAHQGALGLRGGPDP
jgi:tetratricopeptide (TPR) repeat protein